VQYDSFEEGSDDAMVLASVDGFAERIVEPMVRRPEHPIVAGELDAVLNRARELGLMAGKEHGLGLWEDTDVGPLRSVLAIRRLARANSSVALAIHVEALARVLERRLGFDPSGASMALLEGSFGLGRESFAKLIVHGSLNEDDHAVLQDIYGSRRRLMTSAPSYDGMLWPLFDERKQTIVWARLAAREAHCTRHLHSHGFDDLAVFSIEPLSSSSDSESASSVRNDDLGLFAQAIAMNALGLVAIAVGAASRAHAKARSFAAERRQGGVLIDRHPAVALLLAQSHRAIANVSAVLDSLARAPFSQRDPVQLLAPIFTLRAWAHPALCGGANDALQVFGGMGYMRDVGLEKAVRDLNHLRVLAGTPVELGLITSEWERLNG
jgi:alkylation response protein AidB-like acyl-CoA dehydrogenase